MAYYAPFRLLNLEELRCVLASFHRLIIRDMSSIMLLDRFLGLQEMLESGRRRPPSDKSLSEPLRSHMVFSQASSR
ncbi:hypothetical protein NQZ68_033034 [Dissostichus eleginoides]|nr:hypothetical protein NQZ68_033034 [Dissostichus eleginoides]